MKKVFARKGLATIVFAIAALTGAASSVAADYPTRPIRITIGSNGGPAEILGRIFGDKLSQRTGQPAVVESKVGAGGLVAYQFAMAASDGYTILIVAPSFFSFPATLKAFQGSVEKDMTLVAPMMVGRNVTSVHASFPAKNADELLAYMRVNPGKVNIAVGATWDFLQAMMLKGATGTQFEIIRYQGSGAQQTALLAGQVQVSLSLPSGFAKPMVDSGKVRPIATIGVTRDKMTFPDVPSMAESASPELRALARTALFQPVWVGIAISSKAPRAITEVLHGHARDIVKERDFIKRVNDIGYEATDPVPSLAESQATVANTVAEFNRAAKQAGVASQ